MKTARFAAFTSLATLTIALLVACFAPAAAQDAHPATPATADGNYAATDAEGSYQKALDAALTRAQDGLSHRDGKQIADLMFSWQVVSVAGTRGGIAGKRDVTVTIHVTK